MSTRRLFLHPIWLILSLPCYVGWRLIPSFANGRPWGIVGGIVALLAACMIVPLSVNTRSIANRSMADRIAWVGLLAMGFLSTVFVMTLLREIVLAAARLLFEPERAGLLVGPSAWVVLVLSVAFTAIGFLIARRPRLVDVDIAIADLPPALHGFTIAQISDLHVGPTIKRAFVERIVERVNELGTDLIAVTGDLVDGSVRDLSPHTAPLAGLTAPHGVYFVTGNHEYYSGERAWTAEIRRLGLTVLKNEHVVLRHQGASLVLAGVTDHSAHHFDPDQRSDPAGALFGAPEDAGAKILLAHQPGSAQAAADAGYDLQISGHTHGGQFWPWSFFIRYFQPFVSGLNRLQNLTVYVSVGTGYWGPPNRFIVPAEITRLRLIAA